MPCPKKKTSSSRKGMRRSHDFLTAKHAQSCGNCGALKQSHKVCPSCGYYAGREVVTVQA